MTQANAWPMVPLREVLTERREVPDPEEIVAGRIKVVAKIGFNDGRIQLRADGQTKTGMILIRPGDLVVSGINAAKGAIAIHSEENTQPIAATIHYGSYIVNRERAESRFLWWLLRSNTFRELLFTHLPGGIKTELKARRLLQIPIPLPPLEEQRRIVARIDRLNAKINNVSLLQRETQIERAALLKSCLRRWSSGIGELGSLARVLLGKPRNGWSAKCDNADSGFAVLTLSAVTGYDYDCSAFKRTSEPVDLTAHYWLNAGDLLITRSNTPQLVGHAAIYNGQPSPCIYPDLMMRLELDVSAANPRFVWYWLQTPLVREYIEQNTKGTSPTMKKISQSVVMNIPFPSELSLEKQNNLVNAIDTLKVSIRTSEGLQRYNIAAVDVLLPSILDRAFKRAL